MARSTDAVLILGSGPNALEAQSWPKEWFDRIVVINNAWRVRNDWDDLVFPEDFPTERRPVKIRQDQRLIEADQFVPAQNAFGGFVYAGGTMAFTAAYWALHAFRPSTMAFMGCDMVYPTSGDTHFYGKGTADPLRADITLQDLGAKSARLALISATQGCSCVNLSDRTSELFFDRARPDEVRNCKRQLGNADGTNTVLQLEEKLGYFVPTGRYWEQENRFDSKALAGLDRAWRRAWADRSLGDCVA